MSRVATKPPMGQKPPKTPKPERKGMRRTAPAKSKPIDHEKGCMFVSKALRKFAEGKECQMKSEWCDCGTETVVLCHSRRRAGAGTAQKPHDFWGYHGCAGCHANEDRLEDRELYDAIRRTQWVVFQHYGSLTP